MTNASSDDIIEEIGPYKLVARILDGVPRAVLWHNREKVVDLTATSVPEAYDRVQKAFYELLVAKARKHGEETPDVVQMARALGSIWPQLNDGQRAMLRAHYHAPKRQVTATQLAHAAGYRVYSAANLWYGKAGFLLFTELPRQLPTRGVNGPPIYTCAIAQSPEQDHTPEGEWIWEMRPEVARGLELAELVR